MRYFRLGLLSLVSQAGDRNIANEIHRKSRSYALMFMVSFEQKLRMSHNLLA